MYGLDVRGLGPHGLGMHRLGLALPHRLGSSRLGDTLARSAIAGMLRGRRVRPPA